MASWVRPFNLSRQQGGGKVPHWSFVGRIEWHENSTLIQGIVAIRVGCSLGGPLDSPTPGASLLSPKDPRGPTQVEHACTFMRQRDLHQTKFFNDLGQRFT